MKNSKTKVFGSFLFIFTAIVNFSCSNNESEPDKYSWSDIVGVYATEPEKLSLGNYDWATYYNAYAIKIEEHVLTDLGAIDNTDLTDEYISDYCTELKGGWYSDMLNWDIYGLDINGSSVDLYDGGDRTGYSIDIYDDYVIYKGRKYYTSTYFNQHVDEWTKDTSSDDSGGGNDGGGTTPPQNESVSVSISARTVSSNSFARKYEITVKATGSNFTVQQIGLERVSGLFSPMSYYTSATQHTFTETYSYSSSSTIRGYVKTTSGNTYKTNTITISK